MRAKTQIITSVILYAVGLFALGVAGWLFWGARTSITEALKGEIAVPVNSQSCGEVARKLNLTITEGSDGTIIAGLQSMKEPEMEFGRASSLVASCRGYELSFFCAGPGCAVNNGRELQLRLTPKRTLE